MGEWVFGGKQSRTREGGGDPGVGMRARRNPRYPRQFQVKELGMVKALGRICLESVLTFEALG